jgi:preprotein translocase subunit YajC
MRMLETPLAQAGDPTGGLMQFLPLVIIFGIMYFLLIRPQQQKEKERQEMLSKIKKNDHVLTTGGMYGIVTSVKDDEVTLKVDEDQNVKVRIARSAIAGIVGAGGKSAAADDLPK